MDLERLDEGDRVRVRIGGELNAISAPEAMRALDALADETPSRVVLDLSRLELIDSSGVGAIVALFRRLRASGGQLGVVGLQGQPRALFRILKLDDVLEVE